MENASKALLMAAGILIGVVILSLAVFLYTSFSSSTAEMQHQMELDQINNFNSKFLAYDGKEDLTIYDIYTVANLAEESNKNYQVYKEGLQDSSFYVAVFKDNHNLTSSFEINTFSYWDINYDLRNKEMQEVIENGQKVLRLTKYKCEVKINDNTGRVNKVIFTKKK